MDSNSKLKLITQTNDLPSYHYREAIGDKKGIIIFIHGFAVNSSYFYKVSENFPDYDYYAFEHAGHGITPLLHTAQLSPSYYASKIIESIKILGLQNINIIGHSMGGGIAMMVASRLSGTTISHLVLATPMNAFGTINVINFLRYFRPKDNKTVEKFFNMILHNKSFLHTQEGKEMAEETMQLQRKYNDNFRILQWKLASPSNIYALYIASGKIHVPTLLMVGKSDGCIDYRTTSWHLERRIANLKIKLFENSGHLPFVEEYDLFCQTIRDFIEDKK